MIHLAWIAWRLLVSRKRALALTVSAVALGTALFILAQAQSEGLERFFVRTVLGVNGAIRISDRFRESLFSVAKNEEAVDVKAGSEGRLYVHGIEDPESLRVATAQFKGIRGISEVLEGTARVSTGVYTEAAAVHGIDWQAHFPLTSLDEQILHGNVSGFQEDPHGLLIGSLLSQKLKISVGDSIYLVSHFENRRYRVCGVYETGIEAVDRDRIYIHLQEARILFHEPYGGVYFQIMLDNPKEAPALAQRLEDSLGHHALSWQDRERIWLDIFSLVRFSSLLFVSIVVILAGVGMFNSLALLVLEKQKDIAILRAMGYTAHEVRGIFMCQGAMIYAMGIFAGIWLGLAFMKIICWLPLSSKSFWAGVQAPDMHDLTQYVVAALFVGLVVFIASTLPANRAARCEPGKIIRGTSI